MNTRDNFTRYYFSTIDNDIVTDYDIAKAHFILTGERVGYSNIDRIREIAKGMKGVSEELDDYDTIMNLLIKNRSRVSAVKFYYDMNPEVKSIAEAKRFIDDLFDKVENKSE